MKLRHVAVPVFGLAVIALSGCSKTAPSDGGPSLSEIEQALKSLVAEDGDVRVQDRPTWEIKRVGCKTDNANDNSCDSIGTKAGQSKSLSLPMVKGGTGWMIKGSKSYCDVLMNKPMAQFTTNDQDYYLECMRLKGKQK